MCIDQAHDEEVIFRHLAWTVVALSAALVCRTILGLGPPTTERRLG